MSGKNNKIRNSVAFFSKKKILKKSGITILAVKPVKRITKMAKRSTCDKVRSNENILAAASS